MEYAQTKAADHMASGRGNRSGHDGSSAVTEVITMQFEEMGNRSGKTLMLLPGTA